MLLNMMLPKIIVEDPARLPKEYQEVEYIQTTGEQYINTGLKPTPTMRVEIEYTPLADNSTLFGAAWNTTGFFLINYQGSLLWHSLGSSPSAGKTILNEKHTVICEPSFCIYDGVTTRISTTTANTTAYNVFLFWVGSQVNGHLKGKMQLYSCKIYDSGALLRDFVPCTRKSDNVAGLYDLATGAFYGNIGNGSFTTGADVTY